MRRGDTETRRQGDREKGDAVADLACANRMERDDHVGI